MIKKPRIDSLTNGERVESEVSRGFGKYANIGPITPNICVTFTGSVTRNPLTIYMLQQEFSKNRDYASPDYYTTAITLPVGHNVEAKFCTNETYFNEVGQLKQELDFAFLSEIPETVSEFVLTSSISTGGNTAGTVVGVLFALGIVYVICGGLITAGIIYWKKKRVNYDTITE
ncbi:predicted protein [Naegleria gruberi]|uniref:Predicted protein n=1 Tax=Naegleria gruberi TaxID=5762 RepID=D2VU57_NAEGR|nr:uncharacterized protein NAEGRDRAFT_72543 [Naegleria gruberi]EFC39574.1 predicted protein [Naegleria gruberi]|eukprot:XP_002672318.1 predicted protein [Naegleria gruberi strain NEG-M]